MTSETTLQKAEEAAPRKGLFEVERSIEARVLMLNAPQSHPPTAPHPALPYLEAYINHVLPNVNIASKDLNAIYYSYIFSKEQLTERFGEERAKGIREAYEAQQDINAYKNIPKFIEYHKTLEEALDEISSQHRQEFELEKESLRLRGNTFTYVSEHSSARRDSLLKAIAEGEAEKNLYHQFYEETVLPRIKDGEYDVVGFSVHLQDQLIPTLLLASMIKKDSPDTTIVLGGNYITRVRKSLAQDDEFNRQILDVVDAVTFKEGEQPLREIIERVADKGYEKGDFSGINQVIYKQDGKIKFTFNQETLAKADMNALPRPVFDSIATDFNGNSVYWTPSLVASLYTQRGCPYPCEFCTIPDANNDPQSQTGRSASLVAEDIAYYNSKGITRFSFGNEILPRKFMVGLADELEKRGLEATIDGYTRTDQFHKGDSIDTEMMRKVGKYFRFLQLGVESSDDETLESMHKLRHAANDADVFAALFADRIFPHAFLINGFTPDKSYENKTTAEYMAFYIRQAQSTLEWLLENKDNVATHKATRIYLPRDAHKMVMEYLTGFVVMPNYAHEIKAGIPGDMEPNVPFEKLHGSTKLDVLFTRIFDLFMGPYRQYTHSTMYHQRLFNFDDGVAWSRQNPVEAFDAVQEQRLMKDITKELLKGYGVWDEYNESTQALAKRGGISKQKREATEETLERLRKENPLLRQFTDGLKSVDDLLRLQI